SDHVLLRADRAAYLVGETMNLSALTPVNAGSIYLDIVKEGQTLSTRSQPVKEGRADFAIDVSPDLYGALELHAYKVLLDGTLVRDTRVVVVDEARDIAIAISADKDTYLPGEETVISFQTNQQTNKQPIQTALGVAIVDESVFALQRQDPGFAKLYFMLEAELMEPFYQLKGFELPAAYAPDEIPLREAQEASAQAAWAGAPVKGLGMQVNTFPGKMAALRQKQSDDFNALGNLTLLAMAAIPLFLWLAVILTLRGSGLIKRSLLSLLKVSGLLFLIYAALFGLISFLDEMRWRWDFIYRLDLEEILPVIFGLALLGSLLGLAIYAWRRRDEAAKFITLLSVAWAGLLLLLIMATKDGGGEPSETLAMLALFVFLLTPGAYLLYGQKLRAEKKRVPGWLATTAGGIIAVPALAAPVLGLFTFGGGMMMNGAPMPMADQGVVFEMAAGAPREMMKGEIAVEEAEAAPAGEAAATEAPRLRQFFPETLYWNPEVLTDEAGFAQIQLPMADSITTWRLTALASSQDGRLGFATQGIRVFQDFFVDVDLPVSLTQGDEISIPVGVFNYLTEAQEVRLVVEEEAWFELLGPAEQTLTIAANDIDVIYFPIRVREFGQQGFQVTAWGEKMSDAVRRPVRVLPDGKEIRLSDSNWLRENTEIALNLPDEVIPRATYVEVKIYTGALAQVIEGLEKILRLPHG
ncbi:MAG TPA: hypothetical protein G4N96_12650, partial [Chloroflexi bacterium]|nr:hypothetical protein [Chloroflexota bacterium]